MGGARYPMIQKLKSHLRSPPHHHNPAPSSSSSSLEAKRTLGPGTGLRTRARRSIVAENETRPLTAVRHRSFTPDPLPHQKALKRKKKPKKKGTTKKRRLSKVEPTPTEIQCPFRDDQDSFVSALDLLIHLTGTSRSGALTIWRRIKPRLLKQGHTIPMISKRGRVRPCLSIETSRLIPGMMAAKDLRPSPSSGCTAECKDFVRPLVPSGPVLPPLPPLPESLEEPTRAVSVGQESSMSSSDHVPTPPPPPNQPSEPQPTQVPTQPRTGEPSAATVDLQRLHAHERQQHQQLLDIIGAPDVPQPYKHMAHKRLSSNWDRGITREGHNFVAAVAVLNRRLGIESPWTAQSLWNRMKKLTPRIVYQTRGHIDFIHRTAIVDLLVQAKRVQEEQVPSPRPTSVVRAVNPQPEEPDVELELDEEGGQQEGGGGEKKVELRTEVAETETARRRTERIEAFSAKEHQRQVRSAEDVEEEADGEDTPVSRASSTTKLQRTTRRLTHIEQQRFWTLKFRGSYHGACAECAKPIGPPDAHYAAIDNTLLTSSSMYHQDNLSILCGTCVQHTKRTQIPIVRRSKQKTLLWVMHGGESIWAECATCSSLLNFFGGWESGHNQAHARDGHDLPNNLYIICRGCNIACGTENLATFKQTVFQDALPTPRVSEAQARQTLAFPR